MRASGDTLATWKYQEVSVKVLGIRFCQVSKDSEAFASFLGDGLGWQPKDIGMGGDKFDGAVFPAGDSWVELWPTDDPSNSMTMLQLVVDDADAFAAHARQNGLDPQGPTDAHGERIYMVTAPGGMAMSFQSKLGS